MTIEEMFEYVKYQLVVYQETNEELQERIDKAIEQIKNISEKHVIDLNYELEDLLQILKGEDN